VPAVIFFSNLPATYRFRLPDETRSVKARAQFRAETERCRREGAQRMQPGAGMLRRLYRAAGFARLERNEANFSEQTDRRAIRIGFSGGGVFGTILKWFFRIVVLLTAVLVVLVIAYRFVTPVSTLMLARMLLNEKVERKFVPLERISPHLIAAVVASEDGRFCRHHGVDWGALREVVGHGENVNRGASTLTMQTVKNLFLWPSRSYIRKGLEIPLALGLDAVWPKRRILEIYLNIAEWGTGIFGIEAASETYFHEPAADLDSRESALLAAVLPNPHTRNPVHPNRRVAIHAKIVMARTARSRSEVDCLN
jgi:monofunctional glycosyltransferase